MELKEKITGKEPFPGIVHETPGGGIVVSTFDSIINWARSNSLWPLSFATSCCGIEMMSTASAKYDFSYFYIMTDFNIKLCYLLSLNSYAANYLIIHAFIAIYMHGFWSIS